MTKVYTHHKYLYYAPAYSLGTACAFMVLAVSGMSYFGGMVQILLMIFVVATATTNESSLVLINGHQMKIKGLFFRKADFDLSDITWMCLIPSEALLSNSQILMENKKGELILACFTSNTETFEQLKQAILHQATVKFKNFKEVLIEKKIEETDLVIAAQKLRRMAIHKDNSR